MNQTFDLKNMGFAEMKNAELEIIDGGSSTDSITILGNVVYLGTPPLFPQ